MQAAYMRSCCKRLMILLTCLCLFVQMQAQEKNVLPAKPIKNKLKHNPRLATLLSAVVPGSGQIYNRKYWKTPLVWGASAGCIYLLSTNFREYNTRRNIIVDRTVNKLTVFTDQYADKSTDELLAESNDYRKLFELGVALSLVVYALNVVDANVDAHMFDFDVSDDLSMHVSPCFLPMSRQAGIHLALQLR